MVSILQGEEIKSKTVRHHTAAAAAAGFPLCTAAAAAGVGLGVFAHWCWFCHSLYTAAPAAVGQDVGSSSTVAIAIPTTGWLCMAGCALLQIGCACWLSTPGGRIYCGMKTAVKP